MCSREPWHGMFRGYTFPYALCGPQEYTVWISQAGLTSRQGERILKNMGHLDWSIWQ
jgi:hypothetical protein